MAVISGRERGRNNKLGSDGPAYHGGRLEEGIAAELAGVAVVGKLGLRDVAFVEVAVVVRLEQEEVLGPADLALPRGARAIATPLDTPHR